MGIKKLKDMESQRINIENSEAYWDKHFTFNDWTLEMPYFKLSKSWGHISGIHVYGWVEEIRFGDNIGKFKAGHPIVPEDETDGDACEIGIFDTIEIAMQAVLESNHPDYGIHC